MTLPSATMLSVMSCLAGCVPASEGSERVILEKSAVQVSYSQDVIFPVSSWYVGDAWEVAYRVRSGGFAKIKNQPPVYREHRWQYEVSEVTRDGIVVIAGRRVAEYARSESRLEISADTAQMRSILPVRAETLPDGWPFLPLEHDRSGGSNEIWPAYPLRRGTSEFGEGRATQTVRELGSGLEITMVHRGPSLGVSKRRTAVQVWESGKPWWTTMTVHGEVGDRGAGGRLEIEGAVVAWKLSQTRTMP